MGGINTVELPVARRRMRPLAVLWIVAAAVTMLLLGAVGVGYLISEQKVRAELARIRAAGEPVTPDDLAAFYKLPPGTQDTAALWLSAAEAVSQPQYEAEAQQLGVAEFPRAEPWVDDLEVEQFLGKYARILATVHEAGALGGEAKYGFQLGDDGTPTWLNASRRLRSVARLLVLEREANIRRGNVHAAVNSVGALFALARSFRREPFIFAQVVRVLIDGMGCDGLQRLLLTVDLPDEELSAIGSDLALLEYQGQFHDALLGERVLALLVFDDVKLLGDDAPGDIVWRLFRPADRSLYLQGMRELVAASSARDYLSLRAAIDRVHQDVTAVMAKPGARWRYPMSKRCFSSLDRAGGFVGLGTARREVARAAIAVERFRRGKGRLPATLEELVPDDLEQAPMDPFSGGPLHWVLIDDEYRVYSVGGNGIDDGGTVAETVDDGDIVFRGRRR